MGRKKAKDPESLLSRIIWTRVTLEAYQRLEGLVGSSDCHSIGEVARRILSKEKIVSFFVDRSMDAPMEELCRIRKEINSIGKNINQITHAFHTAETSSQKVLHAVKVAEQYKKVGDKVNELLPIISQLSKKWLQK
jgi:hypothetical protein